MIKKIFALFLMVLCFFFSSGLCKDDGVLEIEFSTSQKDYSSAGGKEYKPTPTEEELKAREAAKKAYTSEIGYMSVNFKPMFDKWTSREAQIKINNIGTKILLANDLDDFVRFTVSRKEMVNASSSYHNVISVYKGLLQYVETEDELAYVLGHELGHVYKSDSRTLAIRRGAYIGAAMVGGILAAASKSDAGGATGLGMSAAGLGGLLSEPKITKYQETRADLIGIDFMVKAGYNPLGAISIMNKILNRRWDIVSDHPSGDKRMVKAYNYIETNYPMYLDGGYDTISYERAIKYLNNRKAKKLHKPVKKMKYKKSKSEEEI